MSTETRRKFKIENRVEDVNDLLRNGETPGVIADEMKLTCSGLARWFRAHGQLELSRIFEAAT